MLTSLLRLLSYLFPITRTVQSEVSGPLEVTWRKGRKVLDTRHANYSYGSLQQVLRYGLLFVEPRQASHALLLGLGGGSVVATLRHELQYEGHITAIELDAVVIGLAATEFGVRPDAQLAIVCADAFAWIRTAPDTQFGLIIVDLFVDLHLPAGLQTAGFWQDIRRVLRPGGYVLFNTLSEVPLYVGNDELPTYLAGAGFSVQDLEVERLNQLLILRKL
ncbi:fused MFS/spermidine synthase [Hymenobacter sp. BT186]|uniref:Fused MFS/spermidine synthase n=1 Tax=Hymenobacter telluris TaxID=2816474 RepID=A0A939EWA8_9BACT|nr:fused MFS/spermidine synthase [Hymenobacter telluris]MBO0357083.1 fused MFS/spermidine synthase [Hymenobacter telluris]MBW3373110.1 fused MFS/spermidine synthase [Hymenobacter norwichensis]